MRFVEFSGDSGVNLGARIVDQFLEEDRRQLEIGLRWLNIDAQALFNFIVRGAVEC